jgi:hypothetical protein
MVLCVNQDGQYTGDISYASDLQAECSQGSSDACRCISSDPHKWKCHYFDGGIASKSCENIFDPYPQHLLAAIICDGIAMFITSILLFYQTTIMLCPVTCGHAVNTPVPVPRSVDIGNNGIQMQNSSGIYLVPGRPVYDGYAGPTAMMTPSVPSPPSGYFPVSGQYAVSAEIVTPDYTNPSAPPIMAEATLACQPANTIPIATVVEIQNYEV